MKLPYKITEQEEPKKEHIDCKQKEYKQIEYEQMVKNLNVGIFRMIPEQSRLVNANPACASILGYDSFEEFMNIPIERHCKNIIQMKVLLKFVEKHGGCKNVEREMKRKDGTFIWVSFNAAAHYKNQNNNKNTDNKNTDKDINIYNKSLIVPFTNDGSNIDITNKLNNNENKNKSSVNISIKNISSNNDKENDKELDEYPEIEWIDVVMVEVTKQKRTLKRLKSLSAAYERFVPYEFLRTLGKKSIEEVQLNDGIKKKMTVLFSDIRLFSTLSETMTPEENFKFINSYLSHMGPFVRKNHGFIDKFIGDSIMAIFGRDPDDAVKAGIAMLNELKHYNEGRARAGYRTIQIGIGINTGILMLGTVGDSHRMEGTVISDAVNAAARLEQLTKRYNTPLLISEHTFHSLKKPSDFAIRFVDRVTVKGRTEPIAVYEVFNADNPEIFEEKQNNKTLFETAMYHFHYHDMGYAKHLLEVLSKVAPRDSVTQLYQNDQENMSKRYKINQTNKSNRFFSPWKNKNFLELKENLLCDIPVLDDDHIEMFRLIEHLIEIIKSSGNNENIIEILIELHKRATVHFQTEEMMMKKSAYPGIEIHIMLHKEFLSNSEYVLQMVSEVDYRQKSEALHLLLRIETIFIEWLANHEIMADKHFIAFMMSFH